MQDNDVPLLIAKGVHRHNIGKEGIDYYVGEIHQHDRAWFWKILKVDHMLDCIIEITQKMCNLEMRRVFFSLRSFPIGTYISGAVPKFTDITDAVINYKSM